MCSFAVSSKYSEVFSPSTACKPIAVCQASLFSALSGSPCLIYSSSSNCQFLSGIFAPHFLQFFRLKGRITLIVVAVVDAFHIDLTAIDVIGKGSLQDMLDF